MKAWRRAIKDMVIESGTWLATRGLDRTLRAPREVVALRPRRVLLVRTDRIGDLLISTPLIAALHRLWPDAELTLLGGPKNRGAAALLPYLARAPVEFERHPASWARLRRWVPRQRFDVAVSLRAEVFSGAWLAALSGAPHRLVANATSTVGAFTTVLATNEQHHVRRYCDAAEALDVRWPEPRPIIEVPAAADAAAADAWAALALAPGRVAGLGMPNRSTARHAARAVREPVLVEVARALRAAGVGVVLFGFGAELEEAERIARVVPGVKVAPALGLPVLAALLRRLDCYLTGYTGPLHLADAVGCATVSWGQPVQVANFRPLGARHRAIPVAIVTVLDAAAIMMEVSDLLAKAERR